MYDVDGNVLDKADVLKALQDKTNMNDINEAMRLAEIGKGNDPVLGDVTVAAMGATAQPSGKPTKHTAVPTRKPVGKPTREPTQSPTMSPTRSAMTAGLRGSSSGMPASILPTMSAPTSAALV